MIFELSYFEPLESLRRKRRPQIPKLDKSLRNKKQFRIALKKKIVITVDQPYSIWAFFYTLRYGGGQKDPPG